jgi:hypothetical protein
MTHDVSPTDSRIFQGGYEIAYFFSIGFRTYYFIMTGLIFPIEGFF